MPTSLFRTLLAPSLAALTLVTTLVAAEPAARADIAKVLDATPASSTPLVPQLGNDFVALEVAQAAYEGNHAHRRHLLATAGLMETTFLAGANDTEITFAEDQGGKFLFVGVRGTWSVTDMFIDAEFLTAVPGWSEGGNVHSGFSRSAEGVLDAVEAEARDAIADGRQVILTGHSLGGAVADILAFRLEKRGVHVHSVITFGAPVTGDETWAKAYDRLLASRTFPFHDRDDPAPCMPFDAEHWTRLVGEKSLHLRDGRIIAERVECMSMPSIQNLVNVTILTIPGKILDKLPDPTGTIAAARQTVDAFRGLLRKVCKLDDGWPGFVQKLIEFGSPCKNDVGDMLLRTTIEITLLFTHYAISDHLLAHYEQNLRRALASNPVATELFSRPMALVAVNEAGEGAGAGTPVQGNIMRLSVPEGFSSTQLDSSGDIDAFYSYSSASGELRVFPVGTSQLVSEPRFDRDIGGGWGDVRHLRVGSYEYLAMVNPRNGHVRVTTYPDNLDFALRTTADFYATQTATLRRPSTCDPHSSSLLDPSLVPAPDPTCQPRYFCANGMISEVPPDVTYPTYCEEPPLSEWIPCPTYNVPADGPVKYDPAWCRREAVWMERLRVFEIGTTTHLLAYSRSGFGFTYTVASDGSVGDADSFTIEPGFNTLEVYQEGGKTFLFALREADGVVKIHDISNSGTVSPNARYSLDWSSGWTGAIFYKVGHQGFVEGNDPYLLLMKEGQGVVHVNHMNTDGSIGATAYTGTWTPGWTGIGVLREPQTECSGPAGHIECRGVNPTSLVLLKE